MVLDFMSNCLKKRPRQSLPEALSQQGAYMGKQFLKVVEAKSALSGMRQ